jgi:hypothetical protein
MHDLIESTICSVLQSTTLGDNLSASSSSVVAAAVAAAAVVDDQMDDEDEEMDESTLPVDLGASAAAAPGAGRKDTKSHSLFLDETVPSYVSS